MPESEECSPMETGIFNTFLCSLYVLVRPAHRPLLFLLFAKIYYIFLILCFYQGKMRSIVNSEFGNSIFGSI